MAVLFLLGNGFDLSIGLKSRYSDVYPLYTQAKDTGDPDILAFKKDIRDSESLHYSTWADFEMGMADYAKKLKDEDTFLKCIKDFKVFLYNYLVTEEDRFVQRINQHQRILCSSFDNTLKNFYKTGLTYNDKVAIANAIGEEPAFRFISFNYTNRILATLGDNSSWRKYISRLHIHGTLEDGLILGVDNQNQFKNLPFPLSPSSQRAFIKPVLNEQVNKYRIQTAGTWISEANVICVFGLSLGDSDFSWRFALKEWLLNNGSAHLIYFFHGLNDYPAYLLAERIDEEEKRKEELLDRLGFSVEEKESVFSRVHIPITKSLFVLGNALTSAEARQKEEERKAEEQNESNRRRSAGSMGQ